jgi:hypothetical protein
MESQHGRLPQCVKLLLLGLVVLLALAGLGGAAVAQGDRALMSVEPPTTSADEPMKQGGEDFQVDIVVDNVTNLAAFQFSLEYDPSIIEYKDVKEGPFLGSTGREVHPLDPRIEQDGMERLRFSCVTLGPPVSVSGVAGPDGSGVLATITFSPVGGGETPLELTEGVLVAAEIDEQGRPVEIDTAVESASLEVTSPGDGFNWTLWGTVIGLVAAVVVVGAVVVVVRLRGARGSDSLGGM